MGTPAQLFLLALLTPHTKTPTMVVVPLLSGIRIPTTQVAHGSSFPTTHWQSSVVPLPSLAGTEGFTSIVLVHQQLVTLFILYSILLFIASTSTPLYSMQ